MPGHTTKIHPKAVCLVEQAEYHNLPQGIVVNRCVAKVKSKSMPVTHPSSILLYKCYARAGSVFADRLLLIDVISTSLMWSQVRQFFL